MQARNSYLLEKKGIKKKKKKERKYIEADQLTPDRSHKKVKKDIEN